MWRQIVAATYHTTGDGILTSLKMMECMIVRKKKMSELSEGFQMYTQELINVKVYDKDEAQKDPDVQAAVKTVADQLGEKGRILVRESGTEPVVRVMVEAESDDMCLELAKSVVDVIVAKGHEMK